jgi:tetratricopeptide (TPR) repeat protein
MTDFVPHDAPAREASALPVMLPAKLVGRDAYLARIYGQLKQNKPIQLNGASGIGKTAIAAYLASAYSQQPGGVLWLNVDNAPLEELLVRVGRAYSLSEVTSSENPLSQVGSVAGALMRNKPLVVLDGKLDSFVAADFIGKCAEGLPLIVVSEEKVPAVDPAVDITALEPQHAVALYKQFTGETDDAAITELVTGLGYHPFAIVVLAGTARAAKQPASVLSKAVAQLAAANTPPPTAALTITSKLLQDALRGLLMMISAAYGGQVSGEMLSLLSKAPLETAQGAANLLAAQGLAERTMRYGAPYYRLHPLTVEFAHNILKASNRFDGLQTTVRDTLLAYAKKYSADDTASQNKLATEMDAFMLMARELAEQGEREPANELVIALTQAGNFVKSRGYVYELLKLRRFASGMTSAFPAYEEATPTRASLLDADEEIEEEADEEEEEFSVNNLLDDELMEEDEEEEIDDELIEEVMETGEQPVVSEPLIDLSTADMPGLRTALSQARQSGDKDRQITILNAIGSAQVAQKMENEAISTYSEILDLQEQKEDNAGVLETLDTLSVLMTKTDNSQAAVLHASRGVKLAEQVGDDDTRMHILMTLGDARQQLGESGEAVRVYSQALEIARKRDDAQNEAMALFRLGYAQLDNGEPETAITTWDQALMLFREQKKRDYEARTLGALGTANSEMEHWTEAINYHTSALHIARDIGDKEEEGLQLNNLGHASVEAGQLGQAVLRYRQALHLAYTSGDRENIVTTIVDLARLLSRSARHLSVADLLIDDALRLEPSARDVKALKDKITALMDEAPDGSLVPVTGTAQDYASNAYKLLEA